MSDVIFHTVSDIAKRLDVSDQTVRRWIKAGDLEALEFGSKIGYRVSEESFQEFLNRRTKSRRDDPDE